MTSLESSNTFLKDGKEFAKNKSSSAWEQATNIQVEEITPINQRNQIFDPEVAKKQVKTQNFPDSDISKYLESPKVMDNSRSRYYIHENEAVFKRSDEITNAPEASLEQIVEEETASSTEQCKEEGDPFELEILRSLQVQILNHPAIEQHCKICKGHYSKKEHFWKNHADNEKEKQEKKLSENPQVKTYEVYIKDGHALSKYHVISKWTHHDNASECHDYKTELKTISEEKFEEQDEWIIQDQNAYDLANSPQCTLKHIKCLDDLPNKNIEGRTVNRQCWLEKMTYVCKYPHMKGCDFLRYKNCNQIHKECIQPSNYGCALWEITFQCASTVRRKVKQIAGGDIQGMDEEWEEDQESNTSLPEITTKLQVFAEMKKEMEAQQTTDPKLAQLFKGQKMQCSKSVADKIMYDCCFSFSGIAKELKLSQCNAEEMELAKMRDSGRCHYIGSYEDKFIGLWTSRKEHAFCCFPSKLALVLQEEARIQLGLDWGTPRKPNCRGLTSDEIGRLNLSKMDLSRAYEKKDIPNMQDKIDALKAKLQAKIKECEA